MIILFLAKIIHVEIHTYKFWVISNMMWQIVLNRCLQCCEYMNGQLCHNHFLSHPHFAVFPAHIRLCVSSHALSRKWQITVRFTGHSRIIGPQQGICFILTFMHLELGGDSYIFGKFLDSQYIQYIKFCPVTQSCMQRFNVCLKFIPSKPQSSSLNTVQHRFTALSVMKIGQVRIVWNL